MALLSICIQINRLFQWRELSQWPNCLNYEYSMAAAACVHKAHPLLPREIPWRLTSGRADGFKHFLLPKMDIDNHRVSDHCLPHYSDASQRVSAFFAEFQLQVMTISELWNQILPSKWPELTKSSIASIKLTSRWWDSRVEQPSSLIGREEGVKCITDHHSYLATLLV